MTSRRDDDLLTLGGLAVHQNVQVRVHEPAGIAPDVLHRLRVNSYDKPFLVEDGEHRAMCFTTDGSIQSEMRIDNPSALVSEYTRKMMAFLLFRPRPRHVLMIGLGGGSLLKYCHRHLPTTRFTAIEIDANVISLRSHFRFLQMDLACLSSTPTAPAMSLSWPGPTRASMCSSSTLTIAAELHSRSPSQSFWRMRGVCSGTVGCS